MSDSSQRRTIFTRNEMNARGGCQCKVPGLELMALLEAAFAHGPGGGQSPPPLEDCAIVDGERALLLSTDLTPLVGLDLYTGGRIAALHAMNDIFASGGIPRWALATVVSDVRHSFDHARDVLAGMIAACASEGAAIVGGQTIVGHEALAGLTVIGVPRATHVLRKKGSLAGDVLLLSKPLGVGLILRGFKLGILGDADLDNAVTTMTMSNQAASSAMVAQGVHASTDVSGYGMLGHLAEMLAPERGAVIDSARIPILAAANDLPPQVARTEWIEHNFDYVTAQVPLSGMSVISDLFPLLDPQTNGGLLVSASESAAARLESCGFVAIGQVTARGGFELRTA